MKNSSVKTERQFYKDSLQGHFDNARLALVLNSGQEREAEDENFLNLIINAVLENLPLFLKVVMSGIII